MRDENPDAAPTLPPHSVAVGLVIPTSTSDLTVRRPCFSVGNWTTGDVGSPVYRLPGWQGSGVISINRRSAASSAPLRSTGTTSMRSINSPLNLACAGSSRSVATFTAASSARTSPPARVKTISASFTSAPSNKRIT